MSRYLQHVVRETRSKLRPPSGLRLAPRAHTVYEEIHEERMVPPADAAKQFPEWNASTAAEHPPALPSVPAAAKTPLTPAMPPSFVMNPLMNHSAAPAANMQGVKKPLPSDQARKLMQPVFQATSASQPTAHERQARTAEQTPATPKNARPAPRAPAPAPPGREIEQEIFETKVSSESFLINNDVPTNLELTIPQPVREWLRTDSRRPQPAPARHVSPSPAPEQVIDVTIGKIEVSIESDSKPLLRANRRPEPRAAPAIAALSPGPGQLSRHYLDR